MTSSRPRPPAVRRSPPRAGSPVPRPGSSPVRSRGPRTAASGQGTGRGPGRTVGARDSGLRSRGRIVGIDGLRALAVVLAVVYHLLPGTLPGGMVGVDAFFVISGFLITTLLLDERRRSGSTDLRRFWLRRLRRFLPALLVMVVVVVSFSAAMGGDVLLGVRRQVLGAAALVYNWVEIAVGSSYFDQAQPLLLTNVWSLAVEEQFYLAWPLVLALLLRGGTDRARARTAALACLLLAGTSFGVALFLASHGASPSRVYMGTDTHAFGLMLGAALALWHGRALETGLHPDHPTRRLLRGGAAWVGLLGLVVVARTAHDGTGGTSSFAVTLWLALASVLTVAVLQGLTSEVASAPGPAAWLPRLLGTRPLTWLGTRSYGLYLWHWPLLVLAFYAAPASTAPGVLALAVAVASVAAAELSYRFIETPVRRDGVVAWLRSLRSLAPHQVVLTSATATVMVVLMVLAFTIQPRQSSAQSAIEAGAQAISSTSPSAAASAPPAASVAASPGASATPSSTPTATSAASPGAGAVDGSKVEVIGDSVALASASALAELFPGIAIDAEVSRFFDAASAELASDDATAGRRPYVVVALATNGVVTQEQLDALLSALGKDRQLVLVTGYGPPRTTWVPESNELIHSFAAAHTDRVAVADWNAAIKDHVDLLAEDQVHPGEQGAQIYAQTVNAALAQLAGD